MTQALEAGVQELKLTISAYDGQNVADAAFRRAVDRLLSAFYDDIDSIVTISLRNLFDLFVIKVLYVERRSRDASVIDYLGQMLSRYLYSRELFPMTMGRAVPYYFSDVLREVEQGPIRFQNLFEAYRKYGDNALFLTGIFPASFHRPRRRGRLGGVPFVDRSYYVATGKACYRLAAEHELAEFTQQRPILYKLSQHFEIYMDALNEMSARYILGFDMNLIADKLLDNFNLYRRTGDERYLEIARKYAAIIKVAPQRFPALFGRPRGHILQN